MKGSYSTVWHAPPWSSENDDDEGQEGEGKDRAQSWRMHQIPPFDERVVQVVQSGEVISGIAASSRRLHADTWKGFNQAVHTLARFLIPHTSTPERYNRLRAFRAGPPRF